MSSETGRLRQVILHRPEHDPGRCACAGRDRISGAREQHDRFATALTDRGVLVHYFSDLLGEVLDLPDAREWILDRTVTPETVGPVLAAPLRALVAGLDSDRLAGVLVGGVRRRHIATGLPSLRWETLGDDDFLLPPLLLDHHLQRNQSVLVYGGVCLTSPRSHEHLYGAIYRFHPMFAEQGLPVWYHGEAAGREPAVAGGDIQVLGGGTVMVALSRRTTAAGIERLARNLFHGGGACRLLVVELDGLAASQDLDANLSLIDRDVVLTGGRLPAGTRSWTLRPAPRGARPDELEITPNPDLFTSLAELIGVPGLTVLNTQPEITATRSGSGPAGPPVLVVEPGLVISDERNWMTNTRLRAHGIEVVTIGCGYLGRGRSGPRQIACPIERDAA